MGDLTLQHVVLRIFAVVLIASIHGFAVAATACVMGDVGPRHDDRLTLSPLRHVDLIGSLLSVLFTFGWIRPIAVNPDLLRVRRMGLPLMVVIASGVTLMIGMLLRLIRPFVLSSLPDTAAATFFIFVETTSQLCISFTLFNLMPLPPLTGQHLLAALVPRRRDWLRRTQPYFAVLLALLIASGAVARLFAPAEATLGGVVLGE